MDENEPDFDFLKAFADVDILKTEAIAEVVGRAIGKFWVGLKLAGVSDRDCQVMVRIFTQTFMREIAPRDKK